MSVTILGIAKFIFNVILFISGCLAIVTSQFIGKLVTFGNKEVLQAWLSHTKEHFIVLLTTVVNIASKSPINIRIVTDSKTIPSSRFKINPSNGRLETSQPSNTVLIANHQIYTDWVFLWWLTYTAKLSGFVYIVLKASLKKLPVLGYGMKNYGFIFLSRKWETDQKTMGNQLASIDANARGKGSVSGNEPHKNSETGKETWPVGEEQHLSWPYSLIIFPEGTNMSANTRGKTQIYAEKVGRKPFNHLLLPRTTGLRYSLLKLRGTVDEVYDVTLAYSGLKASDYGQDIYKIEKVFLQGKNPERVDFFIRSFKINEIPIGKEDETPEEYAKSQKNFEEWLFNVWAEKDELMNNYYEYGSFLSENDDPKNFGILDTTLKVSKFDFLKIFTVPLLLILLGRISYQLYYLFQ
ncbi:putative membrane protein [Wickerhamomyces ciferrii]|uniref:Membrane protein n=1 Tax=Wickerhamomyces ciferrii (strain ATCC 14091 / BCRC 22168 / CBS 111 / JCM 3599 / NBRC 0793 / NRRL Y-1031 F-60-10) TaxID=1206466 RepID=K0KT31_WICCF|nr:uncharacterized protein BN7_5888 [Wickerhamomyces ciferrii]CCH46296.1 putative membrane protein [Wickerhamomyces ciferrii]